MKNSNKAINNYVAKHSRLAGRSGTHRPKKGKGSYNRKALKQKGI